MGVEPAGGGHRSSGCAVQDVGRAGVTRSPSKRQTAPQGGCRAADGSRV
ncbi:hypothetical protein Cus16_0126 [Curtobacterium sp. ER1/6]|nr:hypothetical protein Cus16_0126 [Curtobacterium sp. ER1/6]